MREIQFRFVFKIKDNSYDTKKRSDTEPRYILLFHND